MIYALIIQGTFMIISFLLGYNLKPRNTIKTLKNVDSKETIEKRVKDEEILQTMLANIDAYDGTGVGQKDIPYE